MRELFEGTHKKNKVFARNKNLVIGGQGGIRTHEPLARLPDFEFYGLMAV